MLKDQVILITGAAEGLGAELALQLAALGADLILLDKQVKKLEALSDQIAQTYSCLPALYPLNLAGATLEDYQNLACTLTAEYDQLDILVHSAAAFVGFTPFENFDAKTWYELLQANLNGPAFLTQACLTLLKKSDRSRLVFITDRVHESHALRGAYGVSKAALDGLMGILADEYRDQIAVFGFDPGAMQTSLRVRMYPADPSTPPSPEQAAQRLIQILQSDCSDIQGKILAAGA